MKRFFQLALVMVLTLAIPAGLAIIKNEVDLRSSASGVAATIVVDYSAERPGIDNWRSFAQGGEERDGRSMFASIKNDVKILKPRYIRIDHIYDFYDVVSRGANGTLVYNWTRLDDVITDITATGAKPLLALSYMPSVISRGENTDLPTNFTDWQAVVKATIEHVSGRNARNISDVWYEVWNEPDLFGNFKISGGKSYLDLYGAAARGAQAATNTQAFKFGGPATTALYKNWVDGLITYAQTNKLRLDFLSWHRYSTDLTDFERDSKNARTWVSAYPEFSDMDLLITESGIDSANNEAYDKRLSAIHTIGVAAVTDIDAPEIFNFELKDGPGPMQYWGRWGMLTHEKYGTPVQKDRFRAIEFLNRLSGDRLDLTGEGSWVKAIARKKGNTMQLLLVNYDPEGKHNETVPVSITNVPFGSVTIKRSDFLGKETTTTTSVFEKKVVSVQFLAPNTATILEISEKK
jgi:hypothetical protein